MEYHLYKPFFLVDPHSKFADAWEDFCCRLLNLKHKTNDIFIRTPPDYGVDLFWPDKSIAYQCKAVESGRPDKLSTVHIEKSLQQALKYQAQIGWQHYVLCTNVDPTGPKESKIRQLYPAIEILRRSYWIQLCREFHDQIADRFQILIPIAPPHIQQAVQEIKRRYSREYYPQLQEAAQEKLLPILLYSNRHKHVFEFAIPSYFTAHDLLLMLRELFKLPGPNCIREYNTTASLEYWLQANDKQLVPHQKLSELQVEDRPIITLWKIMIWSDTNGKGSIIDLESTGQRPVPKSRRHPSEPERLAIEQYGREVDKAIDRAIIRFS